MLWYHRTFYEGTLIRYINYTFCYLCFRNVSSSKGFLLSLFIGGSVQMIFALLQQTGMMYSFHYAFSVTGTFTNPAILSIFFSLSILAGIGLYVHVLNKKVKLLWWIITIMLSWGIVVTHSRAGWLALMLGTGFLLLKKYAHLLKRYRIKAIYGWYMIGLLLPIVLIVLYFIRPESAHGRFLIWQIIGNAIIENPSGHGLLQSHYMAMQADWLKNHTDSVYSLYAGNNIYAFNEFLRIAFEMGVIGLLLFGILLFITIKHAVKNRENEDIYIALVLALFVFGMFSYPLSIDVLTFIGIGTIALISSADSSAKRVLINNGKFLTLSSVVMSMALVVFSLSKFRLYKETDDMLKKAQVDVSLLKSESFQMNMRQMGNSPDFMLCYGKTLFNHAEYLMALPVLEKASKLLPSSELMCDLGICYQHARRYKDAINAFTTASYMVPSYITPHYHQFALYQEICNNEKAIEKARYMLSMPVKIVNSSVLRYRHQARLFLEKNKPIE